jgi:pyruvate dehydrogenase E2 component (dihydrolipoamide acetyltransferase)
MATAVEVPKLGNTVEECIVSIWKKRKGEAVAAGDVVAEIETDKATFEVSSPAAGVILETFFAEGTLVPVFTNLFVVGEPGEEFEGFRPKAVAAPEKAAVTAVPEIRVETQRNDSVDGVYSPRARRFAEEHNFHPSNLAGSGPNGRVLEEDLRRLYHSSPRVSSAAARSIADGMQARQEGSGLGGMLLTGDLGSPPVKISNLRERIARRMVHSLHSTAQYTLHASADAGGLLAVRAKVKEAKTGPDININDLVTFCCVRALIQVPELNAEFVDGSLFKHAEVHIGFACDTARGLIVPVVRDAHLLSAGELASQMKNLTAQAVNGSIGADDLSGATFTVSNLGGVGIEAFTPLLNPPQVGILGVGGMQVKAVRRHGAVEFIDAIGLSLTCDHQVIDGAPGARFLQVLKEKIEKVDSLCTI